MAIKLPDWVRAFAALGQYQGVYKVLLTDEGGQLYIVMMGTLPNGGLQAVTCDEGGQMIMVPRGQSGHYMNVDTYGFLTAVMKGMETGVGLHTIECDDEGQMIMVPRGQSGNYMDVDALGYLTTVMKGWTGSALITLKTDAAGNLISVMKGQGTVGLETIKLDDEGRMYAYVSDEKDQWGNELPTGLTELAARLGSPVSYDRRGQAMFVEDFSQGVADWRWSSTTADSWIKATAASSVHGGYSAFMHRTANTGGYCQLGQRMSLSPSKRIGLAMWYRMFNAPDFFYFHLLADDGVETHYGGLKIEPATDLYYVRNSAGDWPLKGTYPSWPPSEKQFRYLKITFDLIGDTYGYAIIDGAEVDLSGHALKLGLTSTRAILPSVQLYALAATDAEMYIDSLVITTMDE